MVVWAVGAEPSVFCGIVRDARLLESARASVTRGSPGWHEPDLPEGRHIKVSNACMPNFMKLVALRGVREGNSASVTVEQVGGASVVVGPQKW